MDEMFLERLGLACAVDLEWGRIDRLETLNKLLEVEGPNFILP